MTPSSDHDTRERPVYESPAEPRIALYAFEQLESAPETIDGAEDVLAAAWAEAERLREEARAAGEAEGRATGLAAAAAQAEPALVALGQALDGIAGLREELSERLEREAVELALALAEQVLAVAVEVQPERVVDVVRGALRRLSERHRVTIIVNPDDLDLVSEHAERLRTELGGIEQCEVQSDRRVARGGAIVRTVEGELDARLDVQLARAREVVAEELAAA